jgi:Zn-dependent M28 family amino/carboxypeptidase
MARKWLTRELEELGYLVSEHNYGTGINLVADKSAQRSKDDSILLVTAHLDTVQTAGADDDGSGIITSLTVARALATKSLGRHIRFVAFDEEERGLIGSAAYARHLAKTGEIKNVSVINIEMTGYDSDSDGEFHAIDCNENTSGTLTETLLFTITSLGIPLRKTAACTNRSDHAVFWDYDRPAIVMSQNFFGGDGNPCYHRTCDTVTQVNFDYMAKLTKAAANAVFRLTSASH